MINGAWDLIIAHPPCTYLSNVTTRHLSLRCTPAEKVVSRMWQMAKAAVFFMQCYLADCDKVCVENPLGFMSRLYRAPDQIISPWQFADDVTDTANYVAKRTCLWLRGLEPLQTNNLPKPNLREIYGIRPSGKSGTWEYSISGGDRARTRSRTFPGIAKAMAEQWG